MGSKTKSSSSSSKRSSHDDKKRSKRDSSPPPKKKNKKSEDDFIPVSSRGIKKKKTGKDNKSSEPQPDHPNNRLKLVWRKLNAKTKPRTLLSLKTDDKYKEMTFSTNLSSGVRYWGFPVPGREELEVTDYWLFKRRRAMSGLKSSTQGDGFYIMWEMLEEEIKFLNEQFEPFFLEYAIKKENRHLFLHPSKYGLIEGLPINKVREIVFDVPKYKFHPAGINSKTNEPHPAWVSYSTEFVKINGEPYPDIQIIEMVNGKETITYSVPKDPRKFVKKGEEPNEAHMKAFRLAMKKFVKDFPTPEKVKSMITYNSLISPIVHARGYFCGENNASQIQYSGSVVQIYLHERAERGIGMAVGSVFDDDMATPEEIERSIKGGVSALQAAQAESDKMNGIVSGAPASPSESKKRKHDKEDDDDAETNNDSDDSDDDDEKDKKKKKNKKQKTSVKKEKEEEKESDDSDSDSGDSSDDSDDSKDGSDDDDDNDNDNDDDDDNNKNEDD